MTDGFKGGCLCGDIRYEADVAARSLVLCHCRDCQYVAGGEPAAIVVVKRNLFRIVQGTLHVFRSRGDSGGEVSRHFCPVCGTSVYSDVEASPRLLFVKAGTLDDSGDLKPAMMVYTDSAQPWAHQIAEIPSFPKAPPPG